MSMSPTDATSPWQFLHILWAGAVGLIFWNGKRVITKQDELDQKKADRDELRHMHADNLVALKDLRDAVNNVHNEILDLWKNKGGPRGK